MGLVVERGSALSSREFRHFGHGCQVEGTGLFYAMDSAFRDAFPMMYKDWTSAGRDGRLRPGDHRLVEPADGRVVHTLAIKQGMRDAVDLAAVVASVESALSDRSVDAIAFHRIGTRCQGRLPWTGIADALEEVTASSPTEMVVLTDEWDDLVDAFVVGQHIEATVTAVVRWGAILDIGWPFHAYVNRPELADERALSPGESLVVTILALEDGQRRVCVTPVS